MAESRTAQAGGFRLQARRREGWRTESRTKPNQTSRIGCKNTKESGFSLVTVSPPLLHSGGGVGDVLWRNYFREGRAWEKRPGRE